MGLPLHERRERLKKLILKGDTIEPTNAIITDKASEIDKFFNENVSVGLGDRVQGPERTLHRRCSQICMD